MAPSGEEQLTHNQIKRIWLLRSGSRNIDRVFTFAVNISGADSWVWADRRPYQTRLAGTSTSGERSFVGSFGIFMPTLGGAVRQNADW